jgi:hypothetical protein
MHEFASMGKRFFLKKAEYLVLFILILSSFSYTSKDASKVFITGDGKGYYAYLPAVFIYQDLDYGFIRDGKTGVYPDFRRVFDGHVVNMTFVGAAILWVPFFFLAHVLSHLFGFETSGYSILYQYSIYAAALFYLFLGLYYLRKLLKSFDIDDLIVSITQFLIVFGTPIYYYTVTNPSYTHIYSFSLITILLVLFIGLKKKITSLNLFLAAIIYALIILLRPSNGIVILILPFVIGGLSETRNFIVSIFKKYKWFIGAAIAFFIVLSIQLILYKLQSDRWLLWTYTVGEQKVGFDFSDPHMYEVLFSYRKGLFIYTPLLFFSLLGFIPMYKKSRFEAIYLFLFLVLLTYILSSWWSWHFGMSFGNRAFLDYFSLFAILIACSFSFKSIVLKTIIFVLFTTSLTYNLILTYQQKYYILYWNMNKEQFWKVFLKTDKKYMGLLWSEMNIHNNPTLDESSIDTTKSFSVTQDYETSKIRNVSADYFISGNKSEKMDAQKFSLGIRINYEDLNFHDHLIVYVECYIYSKYDVVENPFNVVFQMSEKGKSGEHLQVKSSQLTDFKPNNWNKVAFKYEINRDFTKDNNIKIFVWKRGKGILYVDDMKAIIYNEK